MRIPNDILDGVCFLGVTLSEGENAGKFYCLGTGFQIVVEEDGNNFSYLVTAAHVLDEATRAKKPLQARINKLDGKAEIIELSKLWIRWSSKAVDLAVLPFPANFNVYDFKALPMKMIANTPIINNQQIGPGDELFSVGLFRLKAGKQRNIPIVRSGILAAMPDESEPFTKNGEPYHAYLAEMRSIGGLSGSPVFVFINKNRLVESHLPEGRDWAIFCIGLIRGHWDIEKDLVDSVLMEPTEDVKLGYSKGENLNTGIAIITPSHYILGIINHPSLQAQRKGFIEVRNKVKEPIDDAIGSLTSETK